MVFNHLRLRYNITESKTKEGKYSIYDVSDYILRYSRMKDGVGIYKLQYVLYLLDRYYEYTTGEQLFTDRAYSNPRTKSDLYLPGIYNLYQGGLWNKINSAESYGLPFDDSRISDKDKEIIDFISEDLIKLTGKQLGYTIKILQSEGEISLRNGDLLVRSEIPFGNNTRKEFYKKMIDLHEKALERVNLYGISDWKLREIRDLSNHLNDRRKIIPSKFDSVGYLRITKNKGRSGVYAFEDYVHMLAYIVYKDELYKKYMGDFNKIIETKRGV